MRRRFLFLWVAMGSLALGCLGQQAAPKAYFTLHTVAPGVLAAIGLPGSGAGSNAGVVIGTNSVCVIDTFQNVDAAKALLAAIHEQTALPVRFVVNTHYHIDHVTGNQVFADAGAAIIAQRHVADWIHTENMKFLGANPTPARQAMVTGLRSPDLLYDNGVTLDLGGRRLQVKVFPGHTGGDSAVLVEEAGVVFTGDLFWRHSLPNLVDANVGSLLSTLQDLTAWPASSAAAFMPGHGEMGTAVDVNEFRGYLITLRDDVTAARNRHRSGDALVAEVQPRLKELYGTWSSFDHFAPLNIKDMDAELAGTKKVPAAPGVLGY